MTFEETIMKTSLIAFDLDGTLLNGAGHLSGRTKEVLHKAAGHGIHLVAASGRPFTALPGDLVRCPDIHYAITSNGSSIFTLQGERVYACDMEPEMVRQVLKIAQTLPWPLEAFIGGRGCSPADYVRDASAFGLGAAAASYVRATRTPVEDIYAFIHAHENEIEGLNLIVSDPAAKMALQERLGQIPGMFITASTGYYIEMADGRVSKSASLAWLAARLGVPMSETAAFGDSLNDLDLIRAAGLGVAMDNALPLLKDAADAIAPHHADDGVADFIERYLL